MRCPKCHYLSFDPEPRCRNCGYDLEVADAELALKTAEPAGGPLPDLTLHDRAAAPVTPLGLEIVRPAPEPGDLDVEPRLTLADERPEAARADQRKPVAALPTVPGPRPVPVVPPSVSRPPLRAPNTTAELPLFVKDLADQQEFPDEMGLSRRAPSPPPARPPLSVRRALPVPPAAPPPSPPLPPAAEPVLTRARTAPRRLGPLDHDLLEDLKRVEREEAIRARDEARAAGLPAAEAADRVEPGRRAGAAAIDVLMLGSLAAFVFWATLKVCAIDLADLDAAPLVPLVFFIAVMDVTYLLMFTAAGGQTIGKMLMGIRVVGDEAAGGDSVPVAQAAWRAGLTLVSVVALGLGWLPALFGRGMALHDRVAHTRVVRA